MVIIIEFILKYWIEVLFGLIFSFLTYFVKTIKNYKKTLDATNKGVIVMLKSNIIEQYNLLIERCQLERVHTIDSKGISDIMEPCRLRRSSTKR